MILRVAVLMLLAVLAGCSQVETVRATQILVRVSSELGAEVSSVEARLFDEREEVEGESFVFPMAPPFSFTVIPAAKAPAASNLIVLRAKNAAGTVVAVTKAVVTFSDRRALQIDLRFTLACLNKLCTVGTSCAANGGSVGECAPSPKVAGIEIRPITVPGSEFTDVSPSDVTISDGGTLGSSDSATDSSGSGNTPTMVGTVGGMQTMSMPDEDASGGNGTIGPGDGGTSIGDAGASDAPDAGHMDAGPTAECDSARPCSAGYTCSAGTCVSMCTTAKCDVNASCALISGAPVCTCNTGYIAMAGSSPVVCLRDVACSELNCDPVSTTCTVGANQVRQCTCKPGYTASGASCVPVTCPALSVENGTVTGGNTFNQTASYACSTGFTKTGGTTRRCEANGTWSGTAPTCEPVTCPALSIQNGTVTGGNSYNQTASYSCSAGYTKTGGTARRCEANGTWSGTAPTCVPFNCGTPPPAPSHGRVSATVTTYPNGIARYSCESGFTLTGSETLSCGTAGWVGTPPTCRGCGDGIVSRPAESCDPAACGQDCWQCNPRTCQTTTQYAPCLSDFECDTGQVCFAATCTKACTTPSQCDAPALGSATCQGAAPLAFCYVSCSSTTQCPPGLVCENGACMGCNSTGEGARCPSSRPSCVGQDDSSFRGTCR